MKRIIISHCDSTTTAEALQIANTVVSMKENGVSLVEGGSIPEGFEVVVEKSITPTGSLKLYMYQRFKPN